ncbi:MAG: DNA-binding transcriptional regulator Fis [Gammaproteobacteria bacterium]|nr:DNA-binding transcriptional regulator Fis [Gammaproteobacteria bacterium]NNJ97569.1 DNA-binding transcriptional regulator Fis [Gammaproteobacteria bacterium]
MISDNVHAITENTNIEMDNSEGISQLYNAVKHSIRRYLYELDGTQPHDMYDLVLKQVEQPLLEAILEHTKGNQSKAAEYLGLNRGTLRKKLRAYNLHK